MKKSTKIPLINLRHLFLGKNDVIIGKMTEKSMERVRDKASPLTTQAEISIVIICLFTFEITFVLFFLVKALGSFPSFLFKP